MALACASVNAPPANPGTAGSSAGTAGNTGLGGFNVGGFGGSAQTGICVNLQCKQDNCTRGACTQTPCPNGGKTTVSGTVYDPAGKTPLYNVVVYVPNEPLADIPSGASCDTCSSPYSGRPITATLTDSSGRFSLEHMPVGDNIPLVIQIGKWRRAVTVPSVAACADTPVDAALTHLPRNKSEGHIPKIAIANGGSDALNCLLKKIGVDVGEFTPESGAGRVNQYAGLNAPATNADGSAVTGTSTLWGSATAMKAYDIMLMSCEGNDNSGAGAASTAMRQAVKEFADAGGRVFGSHWHNAWVFEGPAPWPTVAKHSSGAHGFDADITVADRDHLPEGDGVRGVDGERRRIDDAGPDRHSRRRAQRRFDQPGRAELDRRDGQRKRQADGPVLLVQHAGRGRARAAVRARRDERPARLGRLRRRIPASCRSRTAAPPPP